MTKDTIGIETIPTHPNPIKCKTDYSEWRCDLFGGGTLRPLRGREPSAFQRWMEYIFYGHRWIKDGLTEREEAIQALLMANIMQMDRLNFQLDYTYVLSARMQIQDGSIVYFADATPAAYLALVDEFGLRTMFEILQLERNHDQRH